METYLISMGINVVLQLLKNKKQREQFKSALLKIKNAIAAAFPGE